MKRFSHIFGTILIVLLLTVSLIGCASTPKEETTIKGKATIVIDVDSGTKEVVKEEVKKDTTKKESKKEVKKVKEVVYPYGVKMITKNTKGDKEFDLFVVHTNDVHGRLEPSRNKTIGYSRLATLVKEARKITDNILLVDAGDTLHGTTIANMSKGEVPMHLLDMLGYDVLAPGNHDYNYGSQRLEELANMPKKSDLKVLSINTLTDDNLLVFQPYQLYDYNGFKIAVVGLTTPDTKTKSHPRNTEGISFMSDLVIQNAQNAVNQIRKFADYVIAVGHVGLDDDGESLVTSKMIVENIKGIDLFVDGHSHTVLPEGLEVGDTMIVQAGEYLKYLGVVQLHVNNKKVEWVIPMLVGASDVLDPKNSDLAKQFGIVEIPEDPEVKAYIDSEKAKLAKMTSKVVAELPMALQGERDKVRARSTNLGRMLSKAMTSASGADFTLTNGGGIRASMKPGLVTLGNVNTVLPFNNMVVVVKLTGQEVYDVVEKGFSKYPELNGGFIQTDLQVRFNRRAKAGSRVTSLRLKGVPIDRNKVYLVATNDFLAAGGDGYSMLKKPRVKEIESLEEVFAQYLAKHYPVK